MNESERSLSDTSPRPGNTATLSGEERDGLLRLVKQIFVVQNRKYGLPARVYPNCFVGSEAVSAMIGGGIACDEHNAVQLGNLLLSAGVFQHVLKEHPFRNKYLFYRFSSDKDHGEIARHPDDSDVSRAEILNGGLLAQRSCAGSSAARCSASKLSSTEP